MSDSVSYDETTGHVTLTFDRPAGENAPGTANPVRLELRRPTLGELGDVFEMVEQAQEELGAIVTEGGNVTAYTLGPDSKFAAAVARAIVLLNGEKIEPADLPAWCGPSEVIVKMVNLWQAHPSDPGTPPPSAERVPDARPSVPGGSRTGPVVSAM